MLFFLFAVSTAYAATIGIVYGTGDGLNVRSEPVVGDNRIGGLDDGDEVTILESLDGWYKISYGDIVGYASSDYIKIKETGDNGGSDGDNVEDEEPDYVYNEDFEADLIKEGWPESYKDLLRTLHASHPKWIFKAQHTNLDWFSVIDEESVVSINLVHRTAKSSWKSTDPKAFDKYGNYIEFDSGGWIAASREIIMYHMDPRNFINEKGIFQFMSHSFDEDSQTREGLQELVARTFLANKFPEPGYGDNFMYFDLLFDAGKKADANPYVLASMILVEQGPDGSGLSISGTVDGYRGYYNFFNIGAYAHSGYDAVENGLRYAIEEGWNTRAKSIYGGAMIYAEDFIKNNQNTLYLKKFNVMNGIKEVATHQYMTNVSGAAQEANELRDGYNNSEMITFYIPVYLNMPEKPCEEPGSVADGFTTGWNYKDGSWYYVKSNGTLHTGWLLDGGKWYYMDSTGVMQTGWLKQGNTHYYLSASGAMVTGWNNIDNNRYYFNENGVMVTNSWIDGYYLKADGKIAVNEWVDGRYVGPDGKYNTGWIKSEDGWYYFTSTGELKTGWFKEGSSWYYANPETGILYENQWLNDTYYLKAGGYMATGWNLIDGEYYYFASSGEAIKNQWVGDYYLKADGSMATEEWVGSYYVGADGDYKTGWLKLEEGWYYLGTNGARRTNWFQVGSTWYYGTPGTGLLYENQWLNNTYYLKAGGYMATGWTLINGDYYYFYSSGAVARNCWIGNYYVDSNGVWIQ